jgi:hypothetical protein
MQPMSSCFNNKGQAVLTPCPDFYIIFCCKKKSTPKTAVIPILAKAVGAVAEPIAI